MPPYTDSNLTIRTLVVVTLEGLTPAALSCYGCSWNETPNLDQLASRGCVWDRFVVESDQSSRILSQWTDRGAAWVSPSSQADGSAVMITDGDPSELAGSCFDEILAVPFEVPNSKGRPASDVAETHFARLIAAAVERAARTEPYRLIWIHSRFLTQIWDAPLELSSSADFDFEVPNEPADEESAVSTQPPSMELVDEDDPDLISNWMRVYACQVRLIDLLIGVLLDSIPTDDATVVIAGTSGFRLGQGGWIGHRVGPLRSADVRVPLIVSRGGPLHVPQLTPGHQFNDLLARTFEQSSAVCPPEQWGVAAGQAKPISIQSDRSIAAVCSSQWFYVQDSDGSEHLYLKPDDVDDFNDIGRLREDVLETLRPSINELTPPTFSC